MRRGGVTGSAGWALAAGLGLALISVLPVPAAAAGRPHLTTPAKLALVRGMVADIGIARQVFPRGKKPVVVAADGRVLNEQYVQQAVVDMPPAAKPGERMQITAIRFHSKSILLELNGGFTRTHWYDHLQIGMGAQMTPVAQVQMESGSEILVRFPAGVPANLTTAQLKHILSGVLDWNLHSTLAAAMGIMLPPKLQNAINHHQVLVGMSRGMVLAAKGRANEKYHETDPKTGVQYSDWVYGHPPGDTTFVRIVGDRVVRVIDYKANGTKIVRTAPEIQLPSQTAAATAGASQGSATADNTRPTLRRPGDNDQANSQKGSAPGPILIPGAPPPAPGQQNGPMPVGMPGTPGSPGSPGMPPGPGGAPNPGQPQQPPCCGAA